MKIRLTVDVPVAASEGMVKGRLLDVILLQFSSGYWVEGDTGARVLILPRECEVVDDDGD